MPPSILRPPTRPLHVVALAVFALLVVTAIDTLQRVRDARREISIAMTLLDRSRGTLEPVLRFDMSAWPGSTGYAQLQDDLRAAEGHLRTADARLGHLQEFALLAGATPRYGESIRNGPALLDLALSITTEAQGVLTEAAPLFNGTGNSGDRARAVFVQRGDALDGHLARLEEAHRMTERLSYVEWSGPFARANELLPGVRQDLSRVSSLRNISRHLASGLDPLLGYGAPRSYIVLGQNEQELRPTGGFLGTMGIVTLQDGRVTSSEYAGARDFDPTPDKHRDPPLEFGMNMGLRYWYVRDANWWPTFPDSAKTVEWFFQEDRGTRADGVVAVNSEMLRLLLQALGPMNVDGIDRPLTAENFYAELESEIFAEDSASMAKKRTILGDVLKQSIARLQTANADQVPALLLALRRGVEARNLQLYSGDDRVQALSQAIGADGTMQRQEGQDTQDFVAVVDANISYSKIGAAISRETTYLRRGDGKVDLFVSWQNDLTSFAGKRYKRLGESETIFDPERFTYTKSAVGTYVNLFRIYLPLGTTVESVEGFVPQYMFEGNMLVILGRATIRDGEQNLIALTYRPMTPVAGVNVWKQGGQGRDRLRILSANGRQQTQHFDGLFQRDQSITFPESLVPGQR